MSDDKVSDGGAKPRRLQLGDFAGIWSLERMIEDRRARENLSLIGEAVLTPAADGLDYAETGTLRLADGQEMIATRRYRWQSSGRGIEVLFADGRPFHRFDPTQTAPACHHWCAPDDYRVGYDLQDWPRWCARWRVQGPRKDYLSTTWYQRKTTSSSKGQS